MTTEPGQMRSVVPIPAPAATGVGSLPGHDMTAAIRLVMDELGDQPGLPFLPELPQRGVGADMVGRSTAFLVDLYAEVQPSGWRVSERPGRDHRRARSYLSSDLDLLEEHTQGYAGALKLQAAGPWTLAATVELAHGDKLLADPGAVRDVAASLAEGLRSHVDDVRKRVPGAQVLLQLDEPALPGVLRGTVPTASGFGRLRAVEENVARDVLRTVIESVDAPVIVHCCAPDVPFDALRLAGAAGISFDLSLLLGERSPEKTAEREAAFGELIEGGMRLFAGVVPSTDPAPVPSGKARSGVASAVSALSVTGLRDRVLTLTRLGFSARHVADSVIVTPSCGLAGASPAWAARAVKLCRDTARALEEVD
jgi:hypothetical protein